MSWLQLKAITDAQRQAEKEEATWYPISCPNDGAVLKRHPKTGVLSCPLGDYQASGVSRKA